jgi:cytochrome c biogenesis protein
VTALADSGTQQAPTPGGAGSMTLAELGRWVWRALTSMRVALFLLFLLAVAAVPGSVVPQREANPLAAADWAERNPELAQWAERLGLFDVYSTPWFSAIYLLLMISLVGCIIPRVGVHWRALRTRPPAPPSRLTRLPAHREDVLENPPQVVLDAVARALRRRRFRVERVDDVRAPAGTSVGTAVAAERGYLKETGNLLFHLALVVVLVSVATGSLFGYRGSVLVVEGEGFANSPIQYDGLTAGARFDAGDLPPFALTVDEFVMEFETDGPTMGSPSRFEASVTLEASPGAPAEQRSITVNNPLAVDGTLVHLLNPGYAPQITVRDSAGEVVFTQAVPFLPQDESFTSTGVVKVPQAEVDDLGLQGVFLPTGIIDAQGPRSLFPGLGNPVLVLTAWAGDLGLDDGLTQSVYRLDTTEMTQLREGDEPFRVALGPGESADLPDGVGSVSFDGVSTWVNLQVSRNAGKELALLGAGLAILGLLPTLFIRRRRVWVRVRPAARIGSDVPNDTLVAAAGADGATVLVIAGLDRVASGDAGELDEELAAVAAAVEEELS